MSFWIVFCHFWIWLIRDKHHLPLRFISLGDCGIRNCMSIASSKITLILAQTRLFLQWNKSFSVNFAIKMTPFCKKRFRFENWQFSVKISSKNIVFAQNTFFEHFSLHGKSFKKCGSVLKEGSRRILLRKNQKTKIFRENLEKILKFMNKLKMFSVAFA